MDCVTAHWHPGNQIWEDDNRPACWKWRIGSQTCKWGAGAGQNAHPGAQMIRCDPPACDDQNPCTEKYAICNFDDGNQGFCESCENFKDLIRSQVVSTK